MDFNKKIQAPMSIIEVTPFSCSTFLVAAKVVAAVAVTAPAMMGVPLPATALVVALPGYYNGVAIMKEKGSIVLQSGLSFIIFGTAIYLKEVCYLWISAKRFRFLCLSWEPFHILVLIVVRQDAPACVLMVALSLVNLVTVSREYISQMKNLKINQSKNLQNNYLQVF